MSDHVKAIIDLGEGVDLGFSVIKTESIFVLARDDGHFSVCNIPSFAYGINYGDVVEIITHEEGQRCVRRILEPSGNKTVRVFFDPDLAKSDLDARISQLSASGAGLCFAFGFFSINIPPSANYGSIVELLSCWDLAGVCTFETCEERVKGAFCDYPSVGGVIENVVS